MKWFDWVTKQGTTHRLSQEPLGYTVSYSELEDEGILEAWYNAGTEKAPVPVFIGQRRFDRRYRPDKKQAAVDLTAACEKHADQLRTVNSV